MIVLEINNTNPYSPVEGIATKLQGQLLSALEEGKVLDFCYCRIECEYVELALYSDDGDEYKNDKSSFLFTRQVAADTIEFELWKNGVKVADIIDDTYGTMYDGFPEQPLYKGYLLDWKKVADGQGPGRYQLKANLTILGQSDTYESQKFKAMPYSPEAANGTVRVETNQTGNIMSSPFDFTDLLSGGWYQSTRIRGKFGNKKPTYEEDTYLDNSYTVKQIQGKIIENYTLFSRYLPAIIANDLFYNRILANRIYISDYNVINHEVYTRVDLVPVESEDIQYQTTKTGVRQNWTFRKRIENNIKTNY